MTLQVQRRLFTVQEYYKMAQAGIFHEDDRVELIEGDIVQMAPIGISHASCVDRLNHVFSQPLGARVLVRVQSPVRLSEHSEPQPDLSLLRPKDDFYASAHPGPEDVLLLIEVADTSQDYDRGVKAPLYARAAIPEVWVVDLAAHQVEVYRQPSPGGYREARQVRKGQHLSPLAFADLTISVAEVLK